MGVLVAAETVVLVLLAILVVGLLRSHADILRRLHALDGGDADADPNAAGLVEPPPFQVHDAVPSPSGRAEFPAAADLTGTGLGDDAVAVRVVDTPQRTLLAFLSSSCITCHTFWDAFRRRDTELPGDVRLVVVTKDAAEESLPNLRELAPPADVPLVMSSAAWSAYEVPGSPYFVLVDGPAGVVTGEGTGASWSQVRNLLAQATGDDEFIDGVRPARGRRAAPASATDAVDAQERRVDRELLAAGIRPGDPSLYPPTSAPERATEEEPRA
ncbi:MAG TPA: hypothetical protein VFZ83_12305 [Acidimicrobiia bacterium]|nr:hypothetical protein [Acidimicrobiia bacterium]